MGNKEEKNTADMFSNMCVIYHKYITSKSVVSNTDWLKFKVIWLL